MRDSEVKNLKILSDDYNLLTLSLSFNMILVCYFYIIKYIVKLKYWDVKLILIIIFIWFLGQRISRIKDFTV